MAAPLLQQVKPRTARSARAVAKRDPQTHENPKTTLFLRSTRCSQVTQLLFSDLIALKKGQSIRFTKKNEIHPFEDASSLEFFSNKNDTSLVVFGSHSKKRPHAVTFVRFFEHKVLDMLELLMDADTMRTMAQFKNKRKAAVGLKPLLAFAGTAFDSPTPNSYTMAKSIFLDFFKGSDVSSIDVEGLQYMICISADEETNPDVKPRIHIRSYLINTKRSGQRLPRVEVEEMGPRVDFMVGRMQEPDSSALKEAMRKPQGSQPKPKKNIETDLIGDKVGRIHLGKQDLSNLQSRKMKGLKRSRDAENEVLGTDGGAMIDDVDMDLEPDGDTKRKRHS